jgi:hypothetical protein
MNLNQETSPITDPLHPPQVTSLRATTLGFVVKEQDQISDDDQILNVDKNG